MKRINHVQVFAATVLFAVILMASCAQAPSRKKMPGYLNAEDFEAAYPFKTKAGRTAEFSLTASDENLLFEGSVQKFVTVPLPDPSFDLLVADLIEQYKPYAATMIAAWVKQGNQGVIFDLRNSSDEGTSATCRVEKPGEFSLPVIFRWDAGSASRANVFMTLLMNTPGFNTKRIN
ncbi:MAG: hypothetical protein IPK31_09015 [Chitinophagaceae bacterium]|nr:hypothetical protein [Chitinophagaceae bacterium]